MATRNIGIFAAGRGTRLFGEGGGCKALHEIDGRPLVSFILDAAVCAGVENLTLIHGPEDRELPKFMARERRFRSTELIPLSSGSTLEPVRLLVDHFHDSDFFLSTCDVICPPDALVRLDSYVRALSELPLICFLATTLANDSNPIWIDAGPDDRITAYGKTIPPTGLAFASVRWCQSGLSGALQNLKSVNSVTTDTELMSKLISTNTSCATIMRIDDLMDVDTQADAIIAVELIRSWVSSHSH